MFGWQGVHLPACGRAYPILSLPAKLSLRRMTKGQQIYAQYSERRAEMH